MREIKFRAWFKPLKRMFMVVKELRFVRKGNIVIITNHTGGTSPNSYELMQFTGLKDKNGKEIFEGDIVIVIANVEKRFPKTNCFIEYNEDNTSYYISNIYAGKGDDRGYCQPLWRCEVEVIGNIYENPELLENEK